MSNDIEVTEAEVNVCLRGILMHLEATGIAKNHESFAEAMHELNMWEFVNNQAQVAAFANAYNRKMYNIIHNNC